MKTLLLVNRVWDLVFGKCVRPDAAPQQIKNETRISNQAIIDAANNKLDDFEDAYNKATCLITECISDSQIYSVHSVLEDPVATWNKLKHKFARTSEMEQEAAQMDLLSF